MTHELHPINKQKNFYNTIFSSMLFLIYQANFPHLQKHNLVTKFDTTICCSYNCLDFAQIWNETTNCVDLRNFINHY